MPKIALTDISLRNLGPQDKRAVYWDKNLTGFGVRVSTQGRKSFVVMYGAHRKLETLGTYPTIKLSDARSEAKTILAEAMLGKRDTIPVPFEEAVGRFLEDCEGRNKPRTIKDYKRLLERHFKLGRVLLSDVTQQEILHRINRLKHTPGEQIHAFTTARVFLRWAQRHNFIDHNPLEGMPVPASIPSRERILTDTELKTVYTTSLEYRFPFGPIMSLLMLTGQRAGEISSLQWDWINDDQTVTLPAEVVKNNRQHTFPICDSAFEIISTLPKMNKYLFPAARPRRKGDIPTTFNGWSKAKSQFDETLESVEPYRIHDLRRTFSSKLAELGIPIHVTEKLLNHTSGQISGVAAVYNRHTYLPEMREAVNAYDEYLIHLSAPAG